MTIPRDVQSFARVFHAAGHEVFIVGGAVRDSLLGRPVGDFDFATSARPAEVQALFRRTIPTGIEHGTVTVRWHGASFEVTTYRLDGAYSDARHPDSVTYTRRLEDDLARRDLTINAMAIDPITGDLHDPWNGRDDLQRRTIRTVGDPGLRFQEDALRMIRAVRFAATLEFDIEPSVIAALHARAPSIVAVAAERTFSEFTRIMSARRPSIAWRVLAETQLLDAVVPELADAHAFHDHLFAACDCAASDNPALRWAALMHDIAKPDVEKVVDGRVTYHGHDEAGAHLVRTVTERLRFPRVLADRIAHLVRHHMFDYDESWSDAAVRRLVQRVGLDAIDDLIALRLADNCATTGQIRAPHALMHLRGRVDRLRAERPPLTVRDLAVDGAAVMRELRLSPGPAVGVILRELLESVVADPSLNDAQVLLTIARRILRDRIDV